MRIKTKLFGLKIRSKRRGMHFQKVCRKEIQEISGDLKDIMSQGTREAKSIPERQNKYFKSKLIIQCSQCSFCTSVKPKV